MQSIAKTFLCSLLAVTGFVIVGCNQPAQPPVSEAEIDTSNLKLVSLAVPNMT